MGSWRWIFSIISRRGPVPNWTVLPQITVFKEYARQFIIHPNVNIDYKNIYISCELLMLPSSAMILKPIKLSELVQRSHIVGLACELYSNIRKTSPVWGWGLAVWFNSVCPQWPHGFCCIWHNQIQNHIIQLKRCRYTATRVSSYPQVLFPCLAETMARSSSEFPSLRFSYSQELGFMPYHYGELELIFSILSWRGPAPNSTFLPQISVF